MDSALAELDTLRARMQAFLGAQWPEARALQIEGLARSSLGKSRENWLFEARWLEAGNRRSLPLILRRDPTDSVLRTDRKLEHAVLRALAGGEVPVPAVHGLDTDGSWFGRPSLLMTRIEGRCEWDALNGARPLSERLALAGQFLRLLATVHETNWRARGLDTVLQTPGSAPSLHELSRWRAELRRVQIEAHPELELVMSWLADHAPVCEQPVLVHGDFKPGNALLEDDHIVALLDWETAHLGDPLEDLGWILNPTRSFEHQISGHWEQAQIIDAYQRLSGRVVDAQALRWWTLFSSFKLSVIVLTGVQAFVRGDLERSYLNPTWILRTMMRTLRSLSAALPA